MWTNSQEKKIAIWRKAWKIYLIFVLDSINNLNWPAWIKGTGSNQSSKYKNYRTPYISINQSNGINFGEQMCLDQGVFKS